MSLHRFSGKVAVVTGGANGIGRAIADAFIAEGAFVGVLDMADKAGAAWAAAQPAGRAVFHKVDISDEQAVQSAMQSVSSSFPPSALHVLVNNAAAFVYGTVDATTGADWDRVLGVNVKGTAFACKHALPPMRKAGPGGSIVNISSISAFCAQESFVPYSTTKGAILQMTRNLAVDMAKEGIRCNAVCPGPILTDATATHAAGLGKGVEDVVSELTSHLILKRMGRPEEVAKAVLFLASEDASFTTGSHIMVDGGYLLV